MCRMFFLILTMTAIVLATTPPLNAAQQNTIIYGQDYGAFAVNQGGWPDCERACERDGRCKAWLFIKRGRLCRLKTNAGPSRQSPCCVSGVKEVYQPPRPNNVTGTITVLELSSSLDNLGACIQTAPGLPRRFDGLACLRKDDRLYSEMSDLLMSAYRYGDECLISWNAVERGQGRRGQPAEITSIRCKPANR